MTYWTGKKVLVTGANGFAGSNLCRELLAAGAEVRAFVRRGGSLTKLAGMENEVEIMLGDITDMTTLVKATTDIETVFHLAAVVPVMEARTVPQNTFEVNSIGAFSVAWSAMKNSVKKMVHVSTCHVYGSQPENLLPLKEDAVPQPNDTYSASKYAAEIVLKPLINEGFDIVITRAFNHYGPHQVGDFFVPEVVAQILKNKSPILGSPKPTRDYSYVTDIVRGYMLAAEKGRAGEIYHFSSGREVSIGDFCAKILALAKKEFNISADLEPIWSSDRKLDISRSYGDCSKAKKELGWEPKISLDEGIRLTLNWWRELSDKNY